MDRNSLPDKKDADNRIWRKTCLERKAEHDPNGGAIQIKKGQYGAWKDEIVKEDDGKITIHENAYPDDIASFLISVLLSNPFVDKDIVKHLVRFVDAMDARAQKRHGFSRSTTAHTVDHISLEKKFEEMYPTPQN